MQGEGVGGQDEPMTGTGDAPEAPEMPILSEDALDSVTGPEDQDTPEAMTSV